MRLIDADELIKGRVENDSVVIAAMCAPTAYDVDKVVEELENAQVEILDEDYSIFEQQMIPANVAIEIVKAGGKHDNN